MVDDAGGEVAVGQSHVETKIHIPETQRVQSGAFAQQFRQARDSIRRLDQAQELYRAGFEAELLFHQRKMEASPREAGRDLGWSQVASIAHGERPWAQVNRTL